jgi:hypothetical protein
MGKLPGHLLRHHELGEVENEEDRGVLVWIDLYPPGTAEQGQFTV